MFQFLSSSDLDQQFNTISYHHVERVHGHSLDPLGNGGSRLLESQPLQQPADMRIELPSPSTGQQTQVRVQLPTHTLK